MVQLHPPRAFAEWRADWRYQPAVPHGTGPTARRARGAAIRTSAGRRFTPSDFFRGPETGKPRTIIAARRRGCVL